MSASPSSADRDPDRRPALPGPAAVLAPYLIEVEGRDDDPLADDERLERECRLLAGSGLFDVQWYRDNNPAVVRAGMDPLWHFCRYGWRTLRDPGPGFDVWWYWSSHLDPAAERINPLVHYALAGRQAGLDTLPPPWRPASTGHAFAAGTRVRRICLFAGYDPHGLVDDCVLDYLRELSRHADVYYMADCGLQPDELDKLAACTKGAWASRHGAYDFGSYSKLARDLVGWDVIEGCDELILANDSCYLLRDLDQVFADMDKRSCDWWGMQATKGIAATRRNPGNRFSSPIPMATVKGGMLGDFDGDRPYDFHLGSYFLAFRSPVIRDSGFRRRLDGVVAQQSKLNTICKYEIGIGRYLIATGHPFETFIDQLYPFHPIYSRWAFELVEKGFPFFKRYLLAENHYRVPGLLDWKRRLRDLVPTAPVDRIEENLLRVTDYEKLYRNLRVETGPAGHAALPVLLAGDAFARADAASPKYDHWWAFPVCAFTHAFSGNERALFEAVKDDPSVKKIVLARSRHIDVTGENVVMVPLRSVEGQYHLMRARQVFIKHSPTRNIEFPVSPQRHNLINLWHGVPLKRIGYASLDMRDKLDALAAEHRKCRAVISSSRVDTMAMASAFYPLSYNDVWLTGLPRHDFILRRFEALPAHLREQALRLRRQLDGRRLLLFVPTFRHAQEGGYHHFSDDELAVLGDWLRRHDAVLGVREHMADTARTYSALLSRIGAIDLGDNRFPDVEVLYREAALLLTDYSSCFIDFMLTGKPMFSFAYDHARYAGSERGLFYDMDHVFPGPVCRDFAQLAGALEHAFGQPDALAQAEYEWKRRLFFDYHDDDNAWRVVQKVKGLYAGHGVAGEPTQTRES